MNRAHEIERLVSRRAEVVKEMYAERQNVAVDSLAVDLRLTYIDEEIRRLRTKPPSFAEKTRGAVERLLARS